MLTITRSHSNVSLYHDPPVSSTSESTRETDIDPIKPPTLASFEALGLETAHDWQTPIGQESSVSRSAIDRFKNELEKHGWELNILEEPAHSQSSYSTYDSFSSDDELSQPFSTTASLSEPEARDKSKEHCFCEVKLTINFRFPSDDTKLGTYYSLMYSDNANDIVESLESNQMVEEFTDGYTLEETKIVNAHPKAPLIDLMHEFDHVIQFEVEREFERQESEDDSTPTLWTGLKDIRFETSQPTPDAELAEYYSWSGLSTNSNSSQNLSEQVDDLADQLDGKISSKWFDDNTKKAYDLLPAVIRDRRLTAVQNNHAEVSAYSKELARLKMLSFSEDDLEEIKVQILENKAEHPLSEHDCLGKALAYIEQIKL